MKKLNQKKNKPSIQALKEEDACRVSAMSSSKLLTAETRWELVQSLFENPKKP